MKPYAKLLENPTSFTVLIESAAVEDLDVLVDYITDEGQGRLTLDSSVCSALIQAKNTAKYSSQIRKDIEREVLMFGGNSLANLYRGLINETSMGRVVGSVLPDVDKTIAYDTLVKDVANRVGAKHRANEDIIGIENTILLTLFKHAFERLSQPERDKVLKDLGVTSISMLSGGILIGATATYIASAAAIQLSLPVATVVASAMARQMVGRVALGGVGVVSTPTLATLLGPIGMVVSALWTIASLSSPAFRVAVPCVVQIAYMRQKYLSAATTKPCPKCAALNMISAKFCTECGTALT